jgi:import inner membrane translocase subunit TIM22
MKALMESCPGKTVVSGVMGFALGGAFGLFMASVSTSSIHFSKAAHNQSTIVSAEHLLT